MMKVKQFNCLEMKRLGSQKIYEEIKNMNIEEELSYWQKASKELVIIKDEKFKNISSDKTG